MTMNLQSPHDTKTLLHELLASYLESKKHVVDPLEHRLDLLEEGILDSFGYLDFINKVETEFKVEFDLAELNEADMFTIDGLAMKINAIKLR